MADDDYVVKGKKISIIDLLQATLDNFLDLQGRIKWSKDHYPLSNYSKQSNSPINHDKLGTRGSNTFDPSTNTPQDAINQLKIYSGYNGYEDRMSANRGDKVKSSPPVSDINGFWLTQLPAIMGYCLTSVREVRMNLKITGVTPTMTLNLGEGLAYMDGSNNSYRRSWGASGTHDENSIGKGKPLTKDSVEQKIIKESLTKLQAIIDERKNPSDSIGIEIQSTINACHNSCHSNCHGSRGRR